MCVRPIAHWSDWLPLSSRYSDWLISYLGSHNSWPINLDFYGNGIILYTIKKIQGAENKLMFAFLLVDFELYCFCLAAGFWKLCFPPGLSLLALYIYIWGCNHVCFPNCEKYWKEHYTEEILEKSITYDWKQEPND